MEKENTYKRKFSFFNIIFFYIFILDIYNNFYKIKFLYKFKLFYPLFFIFY